jgi:hypothetical protein
MRWSEIVEADGIVSDVAKKAQKQTRDQKAINDGRRAKADAARQYQDRMRAANEKITSASNRLANK